MLETNRCLLIKLHASDYENIKKLYNNDEVRKYLGGAIREDAFKESFSRILQSLNNSLYWVIKEKHTKEFVGLISLNIHHDGISTEVSYQLLPQWWGIGYGTEIVKEILNYAFYKLNLPEVVAETQSANKSSCKLLEKLGMKLKQIVQRFGAEQSIYGIKKPDNLLV